MSQYIRFSGDDLKVFEAEILYRAKIIISRSSSRDAVAARGQAFDDVASELRKANGDVFRTPKQVRTKWASTRQKIMTYYKTGKLPQSKCEAEMVRNMAESLRSLLEQPQAISDSTSTTAASSSSASPPSVIGGYIPSSSSTNSNMHRINICRVATTTGPVPQASRSSSRSASIMATDQYNSGVHDTTMAAPITLQSSSPDHYHDGSSLVEDAGPVGVGKNSRRRQRQQYPDGSPPGQAVLPANKVRRFNTLGNTCGAATHAKSGMTTTPPTDGNNNNRRPCDNYGRAAAIHRQ